MSDIIQLFRKSEINIYFCFILNRGEWGATKRFLTFYVCVNLVFRVQTEYFF